MTMPFHTAIAMVVLLLLSRSSLSSVQKYPILTVATATAAATAAAAASVSRKKDCVVNSAISGWSVEGLIKQNIIAFSSRGTDPARYCAYFEDAKGGLEDMHCNVEQSDSGGGSGHVTIYLPWIAAFGFESDPDWWVRTTREHWMADTGCGTG